MTSKPILVDCFTFCNELDVLEFRLSYLSSVVDYFVLTESCNTFSGMPKELFYEQNKSRFEQYENKIIHVVVDLPSSGHCAWGSERKQRDFINEGVSKLQLKDTDLLSISDLDEIPDRNSLLKLKDGVECEHYVLDQDHYYYNINCKGSKWHKAKLVTYSEYKRCNCSAETIRHKDSQKVLIPGGWHFSYFGDVNFIKNKIKSFSHTELNTECYLDDKKIIGQIKACDDLYFRHNASTHNFQYCSIEDNTYLPEGYEKLLHFSNLYL